jgi:hypothetical protein
VLSYRIGVVLRAALVALLFACAGCVSSTSSGGPDCAAATIELELELSDSGLTPAPAVCRGQTATLRVESSTDGVLHVHGYDDEIPIMVVAAGEMAETTFEAVRSGQFVIQLHSPEGPEVEVGILTVHEP